MSALAPVVAKAGGSELARPGFAEAFAEAVRDLAGGPAPRRPVIVVHGGGREIDAMLDRLGLGTSWVDGQRVTDGPVLEVVEMMLSGSLNKRLTRALLAAGLDALGLSGVDRRLLTVEPWPGALGRVGRVIAVRTEVLLDLCRDGVVPVVSPVSLGPDGPYNVNADHAAAAVAAAVGAARLVLLTDVPGVLAGGRVLGTLSAPEAARLAASGTVSGGMRPKVEAALAALAMGVAEVAITDLAGLAAGGGTAFAAACEDAPVAARGGVA